MTITRACSVLFLGLFLLGLGGCAGARSAQGGGEPPSLGNDQGRVSLYLSGEGICPRDLEVTLKDFEILRNDLWIPLAIDPISLRSAELAERQVLLGLAVLPAGSYPSLRFRLVRPEGGEETKIELRLAPALSLAGGDSTCLFLTWALENCLDPGVAAFSAHPQAAQVSGELVYAVCDDIDTLYYIRTDRHFVAGSLGFPGRPGDLKFDELRNRIYLVGSDARQLFVIDATNNRIIDRISLPTLLNPRYLAIDPEGTFAWITDTDTDRLVQVDLRLGHVTREITLGLRPERVIYFEAGGAGRLAVASPGGQAVLVLDPRSLTTLRSLPVDLHPADMLEADGVLYVADEGSHVVTAFDAESFRKIARIAVGQRPVPLVSVPGRRIYTGNYGAGTLSVIAPGQYASLREIFIGPTPFDLAFFRQRQLLYVANREVKSLTFFDVTAGRVLGEIPLGGTPFVLLVQE